MKFIDEAIIEVQGGKGGDGCLSFRREKFVRLGGPNGGDGGRGGSIYVVADPSLNSLIDYRFQQHYKAEKGQHGMGSQCTGRSGKDLILKVPTGTEVIDVDTEELIADVLDPEVPYLVAQGGEYGLGNLRFKSSRNRAPRQTTKGKLGEFRRLRLELKLIADVGLLGFPNAGKSTLIRSVSAATPKVADYPFTTLHPSLGVVRMGIGESFVMADIPGIIEGAAEGSGLGLKFLKHLTRTKLLLHLVDVLPVDRQDPIKAIEIIEHELEKYGQAVAGKPRWLVFNKMDLIPDAEKQAFMNEIIQGLGKKYQEMFFISGLNRDGLQNLINKIYEHLLAEKEKTPEIIVCF